MTNAGFAWMPARRVHISKERIVRRGVRRWQVNDQKCRSYWNHLGGPCAICQSSCPWNFESTVFHDLNRELNQRFKIYRKPQLGLQAFL